MTWFSILYTRKTATLFKHIVNLLEAGFSLEKSLSILSSEEKNIVYKQKLAHIQLQLKKGHSFLGSIHQLLPSIFKLSTIHPIAIPDTKQFFELIADYLEQQLNSRQLIISQLTYPALLFICIVFIGSFSMTNVINNPTLLSNSTPSTVSSDSLSLDRIDYLVTSILVGILMLLGHNNFKKIDPNHPIKKWIRKTKKEKKLNRSETASFLWLLSIFLNSGFSLKESLSFLQRHKIGQHEIFLERFQDQYLRKSNISNTLNQFYTLSTFQLEIITAAEKSGTLAIAFKTVSEDIFQKRMKKIKKQIMVVQPVLLVIIAGLIVWIGFMTFLPVLESIESF